MCVCLNTPFKVLDFSQISQSLLFELDICTHPPHAVVCVLRNTNMYIHMQTNDNTMMMERLLNIVPALCLFIAYLNTRLLLYPCTLTLQLLTYVQIHTLLLYMCLTRSRVVYASILKNLNLVFCITVKGMLY